MGISLGDLYRPVTQEFAHSIKVNAAHYQIVRKGVPEVVKPELSYSCPSFRSLPGPVYIAEGLVILIAKDIFSIWNFNTKFQEFCQLIIQRNVSPFPTFCLFYVNVDIIVP